VKLNSRADPVLLAQNPGDFTATPRMIYISALALAIGAVSAFVALACFVL
jgi:hypothetical protein